jgi:nitrogen fixation NifU-like protein
MDIKDLYQELIIDHGTDPRNCCVLTNANGTAEGFNPLCGDKIRIYLKIENQKIEKASFIGSGCAISIASASLMTEALMGKSIQEALALSHSFHTALVDTHQEQHQTPLGKLAALTGVKAFPARVKCATLAWHTLQAILLQDPKIVTLEGSPQS